ncbi:hypothetical protein [Altererythrobacter sp. GH1-8]|uniref:hypothetical protein n=1 Tax=Altererythrobacter sp. GH1-8 TaxID=3349333 RepID=UPI00374CBB30
MKYGLGLVDLNFIARMALLGFSENPARDIARLLESQYPIEFETRIALAKALRGSAGNGVRLHVQGQGKSAFYRRLRNLKAKLIEGRAADAVIGKLGYEKAVRASADVHNRSEKTIESAITVSRELEAWIQSCREKGSNHSDGALEIAFLYAKLTESEPQSWLKRSIEDLAFLIADTEIALKRAEGRKPGTHKT